MKMLHIVPTSSIDDLREVSPHSMIITNQWESARFRVDLALTRQPHGYLMVDAPIFEGETISSDSYVKLLQEIWPTAYVVPDVRFDVEKTIASAREWKEFITEPKWKNYRVHRITPCAVIQGLTMSELITCTKGLLSLGYSLLGLPEETETLHPEGRVGVVHTLVQHFGTSLRFHLLGVSEDPSELYWLNLFYPKQMISCDAGKAWCWGASNLRLPLLPNRLIPNYPGRPNNFFQLSPLEGTEREAFHHNVRVLDSWAQGGDHVWNLWDTAYAR